MPTELSFVVQSLKPEKTVLLFGAGSAIPSGAPSVPILQRAFEKRFGVSAADYNLPEQTGIIENKLKDRKPLIDALRAELNHVKPIDSILNLPLYSWKSIFTTNYDTIIEQSYKRRGRPIAMYSSNFDFGQEREPESVQLFKLHGTIDRDIVDGDRSRIILTDADYDLTEEFRGNLYYRLKGDLAGSTLLIVGHSLADPDIREIVNRAATINAKEGGGGTIVVLSYTRDEGRASLLEARNMTVTFGGLDDLFAELAKRIVSPTLEIGDGVRSDPLDIITALRPCTTDAMQAAGNIRSDVSRMYNGWPASYSDIAANHTFRRDIADTVQNDLLAGGRLVTVVTGASGVGKTTTCRQVLHSLGSQAGWFTWEHKGDQPFLHLRWRDASRRLAEVGANGVLFIDNAQVDLNEINDLIDALAQEGTTALRLVLAATSHQWRPRIKTPNIYKYGSEHLLSRVSQGEIDKMLNLVEIDILIRPLVDGAFAGFSRQEKRQRLISQCSSDMFVCLRNIFSSESFDDIILREYAELNVEEQEVYRVIAAMKSAGVHVHRQLVIRMLNIQVDGIAAMLERLSGIIEESTVSEREGIYAWFGRHRVITSIIAQHKYFDHVKRYDLIERVLDSVSPSYDIEIRTLKELCSMDTGISSISDRNQQNILLRKMISVAPRERVPRHRLVRNLIELGMYDQADSEIRTFQHDFGLDGPATRYRINLATARALRSPGLMEEDRIFQITRAKELAASAASKFRNNKAIMIAYCEVGIAALKIGMGPEMFQTAMAEFKRAEERIGDPDVSRSISRLERRYDAAIREGADAVDLDFSE